MFLEVSVATIQDGLDVRGEVVDGPSRLYRRPRCHAAEGTADQHRPLAPEMASGIVPRMRPVDAITLREAAAILGCTTSTVRRHVPAGRLPAHDKGSLPACHSASLSAGNMTTNRSLTNPFSDGLTRR